MVVAYGQQGKGVRQDGLPCALFLFENRFCEERRTAEC